MAIGYNGSTMSHQIPSFTGVTDFSVAFWCIAASLDASIHRVAFASDNFPTSPREGILLGVVQPGSALPFFEAYVDDTGGATNGGASFGTGTWRSVVMTRSGTTARCYLDNTQMGSDVTVGSGSADFSNVRIGCHFFSGGDNQPANVHVGELAFWDVELTAADRAMLSAGVSPQFVRPGSLLRHYPMTRELGDVVGGTAIAPSSGTPVIVEHPRVYRYAPPQFLTFDAAAGGGGFFSAVFPCDEAVPPARRRPMAVSY